MQEKPVESRDLSKVPGKQQGHIREITGGGTGNEPPMVITTPGEKCRHRVETVFSGAEHATPVARLQKVQRGTGPRFLEIAHVAMSCISYQTEFPTRPGSFRFVPLTTRTPIRPHKAPDTGGEPT